jgi:N-acyl-L-amino-acid amidohydrolase
MKLIPFTLLIAGYAQFKQHPFNSAPNLFIKLQEYIHFNTVSEDHNYSGVSKWLQTYIKDVGLELRVVYCNKEKPIIIGTWQGEDPSLKSILINSHYDVVPANRAYWNTDPFEAELGKYKGEQVIFGRGTQDDKTLTIIQLEALRTLKNRGFKPRRTFHILIVPDEEILGAEGMGCLVEHEIFKELNIGAALDEGVTYPESSYILIYGERASWMVNVTASGDTGHASLFFDNLAIKKLVKFSKYAESFRKSEQLRSKFTEIGKVNTMNLVRIGGGTADNVVPDTIWALYNIRVSPKLGTKKMKKMLELWAKRSDVKLEYYSSMEPSISPHNSNAHVYNTIISTAKELGVSTKAIISAGASDARYLRFLGIPSYGITPCYNVDAKAHNHNEYLPIRCLQSGLNIYTILLQKLSNLEKL